MARNSSLRSVVRPELLVEPRVLDGDGREPRELHEEGLVVVGELALGLVRRAGAAPRPAATGDERGGEPAARGRNREGDLLKGLPSGVVLQIALPKPNWFRLGLHCLVKPHTINIGHNYVRPFRGSRDDVDRLAGFGFKTMLVAACLAPMRVRASSVMTPRNRVHVMGSC